MQEIVINLHIHTRFSDGHATHAELGRYAASSGLDAILVTDHNLWVQGAEGYHQQDGRQALVLVGEEVHDPTRQPQKNHMLIFGAERELSPYGADPQHLIQQGTAAGGLCFIAHPNDDALPAFHEPDLSWVSWEVDGYTGIELWNGMSELKSVAGNFLAAAFYAFFPHLMAHGPLTRTLTKWDELLNSGKRVVAVGGSDSHALPMKAGPLRRTVFPYPFHFRCVNTHLLVPSQLSGNLEADKRMIYAALKAGHAFVGYDLPASTRGFHFSAQGKDSQAEMGDELPAKNGVTLQIKLPLKTECLLIKDGKPIKKWNTRDLCTFITTEPGVYRVEAYIHYLGARRGWIFSNPIYVR